jgi:prophage antirepressor-like protein
MQMSFGRRGVQIIPEIDLYRLITNAQTPKAESFNDCQYGLVLLSINIADS